MPEVAVSREIFWRRTEIAILSSTIRAAGNENVAAALRRSSYCVIYSHWEGAIKRMAQAYASAVRKSGLRVEELTICFRAMIAKNAFESVLGAKKISNYATALVDYEDNKINYVFFDFDKFIRTQGNLNSEVLREIHASIGLDYSEFFLLKEKFIDSQLVKRRNLIVHGDNAPIEQDVFDQAAHEVLLMMEEFSKVILEGFRDRRFEAS